jgi:endo-1,4-beta-D-glucanase Y
MATVRTTLLLVLLLCLTTIVGCAQEPDQTAVSATPSVKMQLWEGLREQRYQGYPGQFTGYVYREDNTTTSETIAYFAMAECGAGDIVLCDRILTWADTRLWVGGSYTFPWYYHGTQGTTKGKESATDGDLPILWAAMRAYERTGDAKYKALYDKWSSGILALDRCTKNGMTYLASGSGIGRWNGCDSYNGVYAAYTMLPIVYDLSVFDPRWASTLNGSIKEMNDLYRMHGGVMPPRCASYNGVSMDVSKCELNPNYMDLYDAHRALLWSGGMCKRQAQYEARYGINPILREHCQLQKDLYATKVSGSWMSSQSGYNLDGSARGSIQANEFTAALWSTDGNLSGKDVNAYLATRWDSTHKDFYGTPCWEYGRQWCLDAFKDTLILISMIEQDGGFLKVEVIPPPIIPPPVNDTCKADLLTCTGSLLECHQDLDSASESLVACDQERQALIMENDRLRQALTIIESTAQAALQK